jgi:hypothetical protein
MGSFGSGIFLDGQEQSYRTTRRRRSVWELERENSIVSRGARGRWIIGTHAPFDSLPEALANVGFHVGKSVGTGIDPVFKIGSPMERLIPKRTNVLFNKIRALWRASFREFEGGPIGTRNWTRKLKFNTSDLSEIEYAKYMVMEMSPTNTTIKKRGFFLHDDKYRTRIKRGNADPEFGSRPIQMRLFTKVIGFHSTMAIKQRLHEQYGFQAVRVSAIKKTRVSGMKRKKTGLEKYRDSLRKLNKRLSKKKRRRKARATDPVLRKRFKRHPPRGKAFAPFGAIK